MPALQQGSVVKQRRGYAARYRDAHGKQRRASGFRTPTEARKWLRAKTEEVTAQRRGDAAAPACEVPTFDALCDEYLAQHVAQVNTIRTLKERLVRARAKWGDTPIDRI